MYKNWNNPISRFIWKTGIAKYVNYRTSITFYGKKQRIPVIAGLGGGNLIPDEKWMVSLFQHKPELLEHTLLDIGANIGQTLLRAKAVNNRCTWVGMEPNSICVYYLGKIIEANRYENCSIIPVGVNVKPSIEGLVVSQEMDGAGSMVDYHGREGSVATTTNYIPTFSLSEFKDLLPRGMISCIKIDVEGAELFVLHGIKDLLREQQCPVICEVLDSPCEEKLDWTEKRNREIQELLAELGYFMTRIKKSTGDNYAGIEDIEEIDNRLYDDLHIERRDYLFLPMS